MAERNDDIPLEVMGETVAEPELPLTPEKPEPKPEVPETPETPAEGDVVAEAPETPEPPKPERKVPKWAEERFGELTRKANEFKRQLDQAKQEAELYKTMAEKGGEGPKPSNVPSQEELNRLVMAEADRVATQRELQKQTQSFFDTGRKEFADFNDRCSMIDSLGAAERQDFVQIVTGMSDGARVVAALADDPDEAARILKLPQHQMAFELARKSFTLTAPKSATVSKAPAPIRTTVGGTARASEDPVDEDSDAEWIRKREKQVVARKGKRI